MMIKRVYDSGLIGDERYSVDELKEALEDRGLTLE